MPPSMMYIPVTMHHCEWGMWLLFILRLCHDAVHVWTISTAFIEKVMACCVARAKPRNYSLSRQEN